MAAIGVLGKPDAAAEAQYREKAYRSEPQYPGSRYSKGEYPSTYRSSSSYEKPTSYRQRYEPAPYKKEYSPAPYTPTYKKDYPPSYGPASYAKKDYYCDPRAPPKCAENATDIYCLKDYEYPLEEIQVS